MIRNSQGGASERLRPTDLMAQGATRKRGVSKRIPALGDVSAHGNVLRGRFAVPQDEVVGSWNDSGMAPQAIEISENGLGKMASRHSRELEGQSIRRTLVYSGGATHSARQSFSKRWRLSG
jgi:hypothetical protein